MTVRDYSLFIGILAVVPLAISAPARAQTVTGTIDATITLTSACEVNGSTQTSNVDFGLLDFGTHSTLFTEADGVVDGNGAGAIAIQCTPGSGATLTFAAGQHDGQASGGGRALSNGSLYIPYDIYSDSGFTSLLSSGSTVAVTTDGSVHTVPIYGRALGASGLTADTYTDIISVSLAF